jgi:hypothetical protein
VLVVQAYVKRDEQMRVAEVADLNRNSLQLEPGYNSESNKRS